MLAALVASGSLLVVMWGGARWIAQREPDMAAPTETGLLFRPVAGHALAIGLALCAIGVFVSDVHHVHQRYLTPLLMIMPFWLALRFPLAFRPRAAQRFLVGSLALALAVTFTWPQIALFGNHRFAYPYDTFALQVAAAAGPDAAILMDRPEYALNIALRMPEARIFEAISPAPEVAALWDTSADNGAALMRLAGPCYRLDRPILKLTAPFRYFSGNVAHLTLAVLRFDPSAAPQGSHCVVPAS